jgi:hypothetical protein
MVSLTVHDDVLGLKVLGADRLWALKSHIDIPLRNVEHISHDPGRVGPWWKGFRMLGVSLPGVIKAGTFYEHGKRTFFDVHDPRNTVVIELKDDSLSELVVEVADPESVLAHVQSALDKHEHPAAGASGDRG